MLRQGFGWLLLGFGITVGVATILGFVIISRLDTSAMKIGPFELLLLLIPGLAIFSVVLGIILLKKPRK